MLNSNIIKSMVKDFVFKISKREDTVITRIEISEVKITGNENHIVFVASGKEQSFYYEATVLSGHINSLINATLPVYTLKSVNCLSVKSREDRVVAYVA